jgi:D-aminoacyl-tRNA deacylase
MLAGQARPGGVCWRRRPAAILRRVGWAAMRAVCQRVGQARVVVDREVVGSIAAGWAILLGIGPDDDETVAASLAGRIAKLRVFEDAEGRMNLSAEDVRAEFLVVSQFTH